MRERLYFLLGGPVLYHELWRATRPLLSVARTVLLVYLSLRLLSSLGFEVDFWSQTAVYRPATIQKMPPGDYFREWQRAYLASVHAAGQFTSWLLNVQLVLIVILTPVLSAGAIVREKERDTLLALFGTELGAREIVTGKALGRLIPVLTEILAVSPLVVLAATLADLPVDRIALALLQAACVTFVLVAGCLLLSLWTRRTADAIVGSYSLIIVSYLAGQLVLTTISFPGVLNPVAVLDHLLDADRALDVWQVAFHLAFLVAAGTVFLALTAYRLRPVCLGLAEAHAPRWLWSFRPAIGGDPIVWREHHVLGLAPLPVLRMIPRWAGLLGVLAFASILALGTLDHVPWKYCFGMLRKGEFDAAYAALRTGLHRATIHDVDVMGMPMLVLGALTVCVRCGGSIMEEKRRKTWDDLQLTPLSREEMLYGKYNGILRATVLPLAVYALPMFARGVMLGWPGVERAATYLGIACIAIPLAGIVGLVFADSAEPLPQQPSTFRAPLEPSNDRLLSGDIVGRL
jgi:ABC-type transport system involved in multi-copper enzyme maturation permease subunit